MQAEHGMQSIPSLILFTELALIFGPHVNRNETSVRMFQSMAD